MSKKPNVKDMSLKHKIGQLMCPGGGALSKMSMKEADAILREYQFGAMWGCGNINMEMANLAENEIGNKAKALKGKESQKHINSVLDIPMIVGMDCEQGLGTTYEEGTITPMGYAIGAANSEELTYELNAAVAREMRSIGANWRFGGPVVDLPCRLAGVSVNRGFSDDPEKVSRLAVAAIRGMQSVGVAAATKHFPGYDPYEFRDNHYSATQISLSLEEWEKTQGKTFQAAIDGGTYSIMSGHMAFPAVDDEMVNGEYVPATASKKILTGLLREKMGFKGVIVADAIDMAALSAMFDREELLARAINAGNDVLIGTRLRDSDIVLKLVEEGRISEQTIDEACQRVLDMKEKMGLFDEDYDPVSYAEKYDIKEEAPKTEEIAKKVCEKSITLLRDHNNMLPLSKDKIKTVGILFSGHTKNAPVDEVRAMKEAFEDRGAKVTVTADIWTEELDAFIDASDVVIYAALIEPHCPSGLPSLHGDKLGTYHCAFSNGKEKSIGMSMGYPYIHFDVMSRARTFINTYSKCPASQRAFVRALYGEIGFCEEAPVDTEPKLRLIYC